MDFIYGWGVIIGRTCEFFGFEETVTGNHAALLFYLGIRCVVCKPVVVTGVSLLGMTVALEASFIHLDETFAFVLTMIIAVSQGRCSKHT